MKLFLEHAELFRGLNEDQILDLLPALDAQRRRYKAGAVIHCIGDYINSIGLVLDGEVQMTSEDFWGNKSIVMTFTGGEFYGESHCLTREPMFFNIIAHSDTELLMLNPEKILFPGPDASSERFQVQQNMVRIITRKKILYMHEIDYLMKRSTREKLLAFLSEQSRRNGSAAFYIPYNRQQLAEHLAVDRSSLSRELSRMKADGLLDVKRNYFDLKYIRE